MTRRNRSLFLERGHAYVYLAYGISYMLNVSSETPGTGAGVLIRALEPLEGVAIMRRNRGVERLRDLARGPEGSPRRCGSTVAGWARSVPGNSTPVLILRSDSHGGLNVVKAGTSWGSTSTIWTPASSRPRISPAIAEADMFGTLSTLRTARPWLIWQRCGARWASLDTDPHHRHGGAFRRPLERGISATCSFFPSSPWAWSMHSPANRGCTAWRGSGTSAFPRQNAPSRLLAPRLLILS